MLLLTLFAPSLSPKADFARCVRVMRSTPTYAVRVRATTVEPTLTVVTAGTLAVRAKDWVSLDVSTPAEAGHGALDWACEVHGRTLRAYDSKRRAYIQQTFAQPLPAAAGLEAQFGSMIPNPIRRFMSPDSLDKFFSGFATLKGWHRSATGDVVTWRYKNVSGAVKFSFSRASGRLTDWQISGGSTTSWKLDYPSLASLPPLEIPADAVPVEAFRLPTARPKIADQASRHTVYSSFDAYEKAFRFHATVTIDGAASDIWRDGGLVEEVGPTGGWRWSRGTLTLWPNAGKVFSGETRLSRVRSYLAQVHIIAEPLALAALSDDNFAGTLFTPDYEVKHVGSVVLQDEPLTLLQLTGPAVRIDLTVDAKGFIRRIDSTAFDHTGQRMSETVRQITYGELGSPALPPDHRLPLPKLQRLAKPPPLPKKTS